MKQQIALIGYGAIGAAVHRLLLAHADQVEVVAILVRDRAAAQAQAPQAAALMVDRLPDLLQRQPTLVVECAGHQAVDLYGVAVLQAGVDLPTVKRISGHKNLSMVERYSHQNGAHIQTAMDKLSERYKAKAS